VAELVSKAYAATLCSRLAPSAASKTTAARGTDGGTIYLTTADRWGNMVSLIHSVFSVYGSRAVVPPFGFVLQNRGAAFSLEPGSPNRVAPRKRLFHTIIAGFVMKGGAPLMSFGNRGARCSPRRTRSTW
jgi:gamma-glutamyltranspeptidase/glutathione hydrolase